MKYSILLVAALLLFSAYANNETEVKPTEKDTKPVEPVTPVEPTKPTEDTKVDPAPTPKPTEEEEKPAPAPTPKPTEEEEKPAPTPKPTEEEEKPAPTPKPTEEEDKPVPPTPTPEPKKNETNKTTTETPIQVGVPVKGEVNNTHSVVYALNSTVGNENSTKNLYTVYIPNYNRSEVNYTITHCADEVNGQCVWMELDTTSFYDKGVFLHRFGVDVGIFHIHIKANVTDKQVPYTLVISRNTDLEAGKRISDTVGSHLIKSYVVKSENASRVSIDAALCFGDVEVFYATSSIRASLNDVANGGFLSTVHLFPTSQGEYVFIDVLQKNVTAEPAEFQLGTEFHNSTLNSKEFHYVRNLTFTNESGSLKFTEAEKTKFGSEDKTSEFLVNYTLVASNSTAELYRALRCGPRTTYLDNTTVIKNITADECKNNQCIVKVDGLNLTHFGVFAEAFNKKTNATERIVYHDIAVVAEHNNNQAAGGKPSINLWWVYVLVAIVVALSVVGIFYWRRSKQISLKMNEELTSGGYKAIEA